MANLRTYRELLFPIRLKQEAEQAEVLADEVWQSGIGDFLKECHKQGTPFRFRVEIRADMENDKRASFAKKFAIQLERVSARWLINSTGDYETEIRLIKKKDGSFAPFLKLYTIPMRRFSYRKNVVAASIHPSLAAMLVSLAKPYLKENAQILDPFCGVGTMLIERDIAQPAREKYGIDIFGPAIEGARENASLAGEKINFIHRDYFDFKHDYLFDEIITNMPVRGRQSRGEMDHPVTGGLRAAARLHGKKGGAAIRARPLFSFAGCVSRRAGRRTSSRLRCDPCRRRACIGFRRRAIRRRSASCRKSFRR